MCIVGREHGEGGPRKGERCYAEIQIINVGFGIFALLYPQQNFKCTRKSFPMVFFLVSLILVSTYTWE